MAFTLEVISGPNPDYLATVRPMVSAALWERVEFKQHILPHEVARELETATLMLLPTRADVSPNAVKECVVAGVPVVASSTGGVPDYVFAGKNGLLFPPGDIEGFVAALRTAARASVVQPRAGGGRRPGPKPRLSLCRPHGPQLPDRLPDGGGQMPTGLRRPGDRRNRLMTGIGSGASACRWATPPLRLMLKPARPAKAARST